MRRTSHLRNGKKVERERCLFLESVDQERFSANFVATEGTKDSAESDRYRTNAICTHSEATWRRAATQELHHNLWTCGPRDWDVPDGRSNHIFVCCTSRGDAGCEFGYVWCDILMSVQLSYQECRKWVGTWAGSVGSVDWVTDASGPSNFPSLWPAGGAWVLTNNTVQIRPLNSSKHFPNRTSPYHEAARSP